MKAITLTQPWATLVALHLKRIETRSWKTSYRGPLAIHAAKGFNKFAREFSRIPPVSLLLGSDYAYPLGMVVAVTTLIDCIRVENLEPANFSGQERNFGDYSHGRYGWILGRVDAIDPVPAKGALSLWDWTPQTNPEVSESSPEQIL